MVEEYPRSLLELESKFSTEQACREYLFRLRWPDGFRCSHCGNTDFWPIRQIFFRCAACRQRTSVTAGTIFQVTHTPLTVWFRAMWWVTTQKNGASALGLQRILGLKSYETAWTWLHKFRRAMIRPGRELLSGRVEVDECYIGAPEEEMRGRGSADKTLVVVAVEENGSAIGRIRFRQIPNASAATLNKFLLESVAPGSTVHTDGWRGYRKVSSLGFVHEVTVLKGKKEKASELLPRVHLVISLLKRWLMGTHQGAVSHKHLDYYLAALRKESRYPNDYEYQPARAAAQYIVVFGPRLASRFRGGCRENIPSSSRLRSRIRDYWSVRSDKADETANVAQSLVELTISEDPCGVLCA